MKAKILFTLFILCVFSFKINSQEKDKKKPLMIDMSTIIKDEKGNTIDIFKLQELVKTNEWKVDAVRDDKGNIKYVQLRKATDAEKQEMMNKRPNRDVKELLGKKAPNFKIIDSNGNKIDSENIDNKIIVLNFWFTACPPCIEELPELNSIYEKYSSNEDIVFAAVTFDSKDKVNSFKEKYKIKYPIVFDALETCKLFGVTGYPSNIVIDKNGVISEVLVGGGGQVANISTKLSNAIDLALKK